MSERILVVDDEQYILRIFSFLLGKWGFEVITAQNGQEGLNILKNDKPDLILLDMSMPVMDGFQMLEQLRKDPQLKDIPVIMLTANSDTKNIKEASTYGIEDYLTKPFEPEDLRQRIDSILAKVN